MPFRYACFISYCHGQSELTKTFIEQLKDALNNHLDPYLDEKVYIDKERLQPGSPYNEALAKAICESICMIVVYSPKYEWHSYCLREYQAMERIEKERMRLLGGRAISERGMIIPLIFRGKIEDLPPKIKKYRQCSGDFSEFTLATIDLSSNPDYTRQIENIAKYIHEYFKFFRENDVDVCGDCNSFRLPCEEEIQPWREKAKKPMAFPGRVVTQ